MARISKITEDALKDRDAIATALVASNNHTDQIRDLRTAVQADAEWFDDCCVAATEFESWYVDTKKALSDSQTKATQLLETITKLLPGATSVGLAAAFRTRKREFRWAKLGWLCAFFVSVAVLIGLSILVPKGLFLSDVKNLELLTVYLGQRTPLYLPVLAVAIYASKHYGLALKLEEDYAYKEALATSFEGYKREVESLPDGADILADLCAKLIDTISAPPGRLIGRHPEFGSAPTRGVDQDDPK